MPTPTPISMTTLLDTLDPGTGSGALLLFLVGGIVWAGLSWLWRFVASRLPSAWAPKLLRPSSVVGLVVGVCFVAVPMSTVLTSFTQWLAAVALIPPYLMVMGWLGGLLGDRTVRAYDKRLTAQAAAALPDSSPAAVPASKPPIVYTLHPEAAHPVGLRMDEVYEGIRVGVQRIGYDLVLTVTNLNPAGTFLVLYRILRLDGEVLPTSEGTRALPWAPPEGELWHPLSAKQLYLKSGLTYRGVGRVRFGTREYHPQRSKSVTLFSFAEIDREARMGELLTVRQADADVLQVEVEATVIRVQTVHGEFFNGDAECTAHVSVSWPSNRPEPALSCRSEALQIGPGEEA